MINKISDLDHRSHALAILLPIRSEETYSGCFAEQIILTLLTPKSEQPYFRCYPPSQSSDGLACCYPQWLRATLLQPDQSSRYYWVRAHVILPITHQVRAAAAAIPRLLTAESEQPCSACHLPAMSEKPRSCHLPEGSEQPFSTHLHLQTCSHYHTLVQKNHSPAVTCLVRAAMVPS